MLYLTPYSNPKLHYSEEMLLSMIIPKETSLFQKQGHACSTAEISVILIPCMILYQSYSLDHPYCDNQHHNQIISRVPSIRENKHIEHHRDHEAICRMSPLLGFPVAGIDHSIVKMLFLRFFAFLAAG
ncbi:hypothetical protein OS493_032771 [Desmophyllum pertusum]|uniref:Uncharacterized protein n=1 Tax=Desmophyllum pertusum TaxID=174260 RepID=A0A9W9ZK37_9CNID|nr:hypothetical protein OS493_032771 [Desmophyllum pertusum]